MNLQSLKWNELLFNQKNQHQDIANEIAGKSVAFLDMPMYFNVGDILILKGTERFFSEYNINVIYKSCLTEHSLENSSLSKADIILFQGGGNFGDLYPIHQKFREKVVQQYPDKKIICLPQSVHFDSQDNLEKSASIFRQHDNFVMYVRDKQSYNLAKNFTDKVKLIPDMAYSLHPLKTTLEIECHFDKNKAYSLLNMIRNDIEGVPSNLKNIKQSFDWKDIVTLQNKRDLNLAKNLLDTPVIRNIPFFRKLGMSTYEKLSDEVMFKSINYFNSFDIVSSDRLHGVILSTLLGKFICMSDNSYGKVSSYTSLWLHDYPLYLNIRDISSN